MQPVIRTVGLEELGLDEFKLHGIRDLLRHETDKLADGLSVECGVTVHAKAYDKEGSRKKYSIHIRFTAPGTLLVSGKLHDWDLPVAIRAAYRNLQARLQASREQASSHSHQRRQRRVTSFV
jgi:hypothetical protein